MTDLYIGLAIMSALMGVSFGLALLVTKQAPLWVVDAMAAVVVILIAVYARFVWEESFVANLLPFSNLIVISNWLPLAAGVLAGLVWRRIGNSSAKFLGLGKEEYSSRPRKVFAVAVLFIAGFLAVAWPLRGEPPVCDNRWEGNICLQTTAATCSAAAGATLLQNYGVYASEQEMARLCLTRRGTSWKGLYRGLMLKGEAADRKVLVEETTVDRLATDFNDPCILQCELELEAAGLNGVYEAQGWVPEQPHSVVLMDVIDTKQGTVFLIADPTNFVEGWSREDMQTLWHGQVLRLVPVNE